MKIDRSKNAKKPLKAINEWKMVHWLIVNDLASGMRDKDDIIAYIFWTWMLFMQEWRINVLFRLLFVDFSARKVA